MAAAVLVLTGICGVVQAQNIIYSCEMSDGSIVLETEPVGKKCQKLSETAAPPKPAAAPAPAAAAKAPAVAAAPTAAKSGQAAATPASAAAGASGPLVVKAPPQPVRVPPKKVAAETYHDIQVKKAENALQTDDPEHGIVGAAPTTNSSRRYLMTDRAHYQKTYGAPAPAADAAAQK